MAASPSTVYCSSLHSQHLRALYSFTYSTFNLIFVACDIKYFAIIALIKILRNIFKTPTLLLVGAY